MAKPVPVSKPKKKAAVVTTKVNPWKMTPAEKDEYLKNSKRGNN